MKACLRSQLPTLFTPEIVIQLDEKTVERIAGESEESAVEREELRQKLEALKKTQQVLRDLSGNGGTRFSSNTEPANRALVQ